MTEENKLKRRASHQKWLAKNPDYMKNYRAAHKEERLNYNRQYALSHKEEMAEYSRAYNSTHKKEIAAITRAWHVNNPVKAMARFYKRRAIKKKAAIDPFNSAELVAHIEAMGNCCVYCNGPYEDLDHVYPLSKGGPHALSNLVPSCKPCNRKKWNGLPLGWLIGGSPCQAL